MGSRIVKKLSSHIGLLASNVSSAQAPGGARRRSGHGQGSTGTL